MFNALALPNDMDDLKPAIVEPARLSELFGIDERTTQWQVECST